MPSEADPIRVNVDLTNPGQFFACCGLFELADRLWPGAEAWFENGEFLIRGGTSLRELLQFLTRAKLKQLDPEDNTSSPIELLDGSNVAHWQPLRLNWWHDDKSGGKDLKVWAGTMESVRIARAMQQALASESLWTAAILDAGMIVYDPDEPSKKVEPFYFDSRRGPNAHSRDVGFSANDLSLTTTASPAVELLCLIGLQRFRPRRSGSTRTYFYSAWSEPLSVVAAQAVVPGHIGLKTDRVYTFENWYRTGQKKHKAFRPATQLVSQGN